MNPIKWLKKVVRWPFPILSGFYFACHMLEVVPPHAGLQYITILPYFDPHFYHLIGYCTLLVVSIYFCISIYTNILWNKRPLSYDHAGAEMVLPLLVTNRTTTIQREQL